MRRLASIALLLAGCASAPSKPQADNAPGPDAGQPAPAQPAARVSDPGQRLAFHLAEMIRAITAAGDCDKANAAALAYLEKNRAAMREAVLELKRKTSAMSSEAGEQYFVQVMKLMDELYPQAEVALKGFDERCPSQSEVLGNALDSLERE